MGLDLLVVGAGIGGSTLTRMAREAGLTVELWDPAPERAASQAGLALLRKTWHADVPEALRWYDSIGALAPTRTIQSDDTGAERSARGYSLVHPADLLLEPDRAERWDPDALAIGARAVVLSHPVLHNEMAPEVTFGVTWASPSAKLPVGDARIHWSAPYQAVIAVAGRGGGARVGASVAHDAQKAMERARRMLDLATSLGMVTETDDWTALAGVRHPVSAPAMLEEGLWDLGGFGRMGYSLAPARCRRLLEALAL